MTPKTLSSKILFLVLMALGGVVAATIISEAAPYEAPNSQGLETPTYYIVPFEWVEDINKPNYFYWKSKYDHLGSLIDLRVSTEQSIRPTVGTTQCCALIQSDIQLNNADTTLISRNNLTEIETRLGISGLRGGTIQDILFQILVENGDSLGEIKWKPLKFDNEFVVRAYLGESRVFSVNVKENLNVWNNVVSVYRADYDRIKARDPELAKKVAGYWIEEFGVDVRTPDQQKDGHLQPETLFTDDFDCADSDTMGCDLTWTEVTADWDIVSNQATKTANSTGTARADSDVSSDDHYGEVTCNNVEDFDWCGVMIRFSSSADTGYYFRFENDNSSNLIYKRVTGTDTLLVGGSDAEYCGGTCPARTLKLQANGSDLEAFLNGSSVETTTDTSITGNTRCGLWGFDVSPNYNDFSCEDLAAGADRRLMLID